MPGPPPNPNARRRNDRDAWRTVPTKCTRPVPKWPIGRKPKGVDTLWRHLWALPVAEIWHEQNAVLVVARYATLTTALQAQLDYVRADDGADEFDKPATVDLSKLPAELRQIEDRLLISPLTRIRARVLVAADQAPATPDKQGTVTHLDDYRDLGIA